MKTGCPIALRQTGQIGLLGCAQKASATSGCPIAVEPAAQIQLLPPRGAQQRAESGEAVAPLDQERAEAHQRIRPHRRPHLPAHRARWADADQRADRVKRQQAAFFNYYQPEAQDILRDLLEKYARDGGLQLVAVREHLPDVLKLPPISPHGNVNEIIGKFGGADQFRTAVNQLQSLLYAA